MMEINEHDKMVTNLFDQLENILLLWKKHNKQVFVVWIFSLKSIFKRTMNLIRIGMHECSYETFKYSLGAIAITFAELPYYSVFKNLDWIVLQS